MVEGVNPVTWKLHTVVNCYNGKGDSLKRGNYRGLKLTDHVLKKAKKVLRKLIRQHVDIDD